VGIRFALRSDNANLQAYRSYAGSSGFPYYTSVAPAQGADVLAISGQRYNLYGDAASQNAILYSGKENIHSGTGNDISILYRCRGVSSGNLNGNLWGFAGPNGYPGLRMFLQLNYSTKVLTYNVTSENGDAIVNGTVGLTGIVGTSFYNDYLVTFSGTTAATAYNIYVDSTAVVTTGATLNWNANFNFSQLGLFCLGQATNSRQGVHGFNECVIWDEIVNPSLISCGGVTTSLNGQTRTAFVDAVAFDGALCTNVGESNVTNGLTYAIDGVYYSGTNVNLSPGASNVLSGITFAINSAYYVGTLQQTASTTSNKSVLGFNIGIGSY
jgi:hypothetical protein